MNNEKELNQNIDQYKKSAVRTLQNLNYTYHGGQLWKPPLGKAPAYITNEIKLPISWLEEKGIKRTNHDVYGVGDNIGFITSFADRENTGKQPVDDWVPVECIAVGGKEYNASAKEMNWTTEGPSFTFNINKWKPNAKALMEIYLAEQEDKKQIKNTCDTKLPHAIEVLIDGWISENQIYNLELADDLAKSAFEYAFKMADDNLKNQNVIFGILTNGEIFVEVNGIQHTPQDSFYKLATIESSKLAHQVRDLKIKLKSSDDVINCLSRQIQVLLGNIQ